MFPVVVGLVFLISASEALAQSLAYLSHKHTSLLLFGASWLVYALIVYLLYRSYEYKGVGYINVLWSGFTTLLMIIIGYFVFGERLTVIEWIGAFFVLFGIALMAFHNLMFHL